MAAQMLTPGDERAQQHNPIAELDAFLEAFSLLEFGRMPEEILKKIA